MDHAGGRVRDDATEQLSVAEITHGGSHSAKPFWYRMSPLLLTCIITTTVLGAAECVLGLVDVGTGAVGRDWLIGIGGAVSLAFTAAVATGLRDYADLRVRASEERIRGYIQHETYRLEQAQQPIRDQIALLRSEMLALLGELPRTVVAYGDDRDDEGEQRAVRRLVAAGEDTDRARGVAHLRSVENGT